MWWTLILKYFLITLTLFWVFFSFNLNYKYDNSHHNRQFVTVYFIFYYSTFNFVRNPKMKTIYIWKGFTFLLHTFYRGRPISCMGKYNFSWNLAVISTELVVNENQQAYPVIGTNLKLQITIHKPHMCDQSKQIIIFHIFFILLAAFWIFRSLGSNIIFIFKTTMSKHFVSVWVII